MEDEFAPSPLSTAPARVRTVDDDNVFVMIFDRVADALMRLPKLLYEVPSWDVRNFPVLEKLAPLLEQLDVTASKPQVSALHSPSILPRPPPLARAQPVALRPSHTQRVS